jgi:hypothetical protein
MPARISARIDRETMSLLLNELTPLRLDLSDFPGRERWLEIRRPDAIDFVEDVGLRITTSAELKWTVRRLAVPVTVESITLMLELKLLEKARVTVWPRVEKVKLKKVPGLVDKKLLEVINQKLSGLGDSLGWSFGETLALSVGAPSAMTEIAAFEIAAAKADLRISDRAVELALDVPVRLRRR